MIARFPEQYAQARESLGLPRLLPVGSAAIAEGGKQGGKKTAEQVLPGGTDKELRSGSAAVSEINVQDLRSVVNPSDLAIIRSRPSRYSHRLKTGTRAASMLSQLWEQIQPCVIHPASSRGEPSGIPESKASTRLPASRSAACSTSANFRA